MDKVVIYGTGRHAELTAFYMKQNGQYEVVAFTVKKEFLDKSTLADLPVVPFENITEIYPTDKFKMFIAIGPQNLNRIREELFIEIKSKGYKFVNCICCSEHKLSSYTVGENVFIGPSTLISAFISIGNNVIIIDSHIGHHCTIDDNTFISGSILGGNINVGKNVFIGLGSIIGPNITLGDYTVVGMGCTISKSTAPASVYLNKATEKQSFDSSKLKFL
ncbi:acetyltransferase [Aequorivita sp. KMM 9714]|uniref:acetyltransferase n=1 Tax=Aequorivita sp. KMM 9714 TaxID=2707173 RepID=UPI0013EDAFD9|nr:acetyltransferase [Aequorivita sp. KMM 9714]NGX84750.1 acetyltransferase [Aequorivita sp. KMM 9714]